LYQKSLKDLQSKDITYQRICMTEMKYKINAYSNQDSKEN